MAQICVFKDLCLLLQKEMRRNAPQGVKSRNIRHINQSISYLEVPRKFGDLKRYREDLVRVHAGAWAELITLYRLRQIPRVLDKESSRFLCVHKYPSPLDVTCISSDLD